MSLWQKIFGGKEKVVPVRSVSVRMPSPEQVDTVPKEEDIHDKIASSEKDKFGRSVVSFHRR